MVEATDGCDINQGRYAKRSKVLILSTYTRIFTVSDVREAFHNELAK
jgi:hypothetical protein